MDVQAIDLSPLEVLKRFRDMEPHLPHKEFKLYKTTARFYLNNDDDMAQTCAVEAENMMNFAGLVGYTPHISFEDLENAAGNINLNPSLHVHINLNKTVRCDSQAIMSTLAHEICHKVLYRYLPPFSRGPVMDIENEVMTDLATFYVGFGNLTMSGFYSRSYDTEHRMGYLTPRTYGIAYIISCVVNGIDPRQQYLPNHAKAAINEAYQCLSSDFFDHFRNEENLIKIFVNAGQKNSLLLLKIDYLMQLLLLQRSSIVDAGKKLHHLFYGKNLCKNLKATPYMALAASHLLSTEGDLNQQAETDNKLGNNLDRFIKAMTSSLSRKNIAIPDWNARTYCCPFCEKEIKSDMTEKRVYHLRCRNCNSHFIVDNTHTSPTDRETANENKGTDAENGKTTQTKYVYVGANYGEIKDIPMGLRWGLFFKAIRQNWTYLIRGKEND